MAMTSSASLALFSAKRSAFYLLMHSLSLRMKISFDDFVSFPKIFFFDLFAGSVYLTVIYRIKNSMNTKDTLSIM